MGDPYRRVDFPSVQDWLYCKRMTELVWAEEAEEAIKYTCGSLSALARVYIYIYIYQTKCLCTEVEYKDNATKCLGDQT